VQETLQWLANPANLNADVLPPGLETYDPIPFLSSTGNVFMVTLLPQVRPASRQLLHGTSVRCSPPQQLGPVVTLGLCCWTRRCGCNLQTVRAPPSQTPFPHPPCPPPPSPPPVGP
jgi:hypothetical protein